MRNRKIISIIYIMIIMLISNSILVYANEHTLNINIDGNEHIQGEKIKIQVNIEDINDIYGIIGKIEYDEEVFENISNITTTWNDIQYNKNTKEFIILRNSTVENKQILEIELQIKENAKIGNTNITIKDIKASDSNNDIEIEEVTITTDIKKSINNNIEPTNTPSIQPTNKPDTPVIPDATEKPVIPSNSPTPTNTPEVTSTPNKTEKPINTALPTDIADSEKKDTNNNKVTNIKTGDKKPIIALGIIGLVIIINIIYKIKNKD